MLAATIIYNPLSVFASETTNSTSSSFTDGVSGYNTIGEDTTQGKTSSSETIENISNGSSSQEVEVYATQVSSYSVIIPKIITLDGNTKEGNYQVAVKGDIAGNQQIKISAPSTFEMSDQSGCKNNIQATIMTETNGGAKTTWTQSEITVDSYDGTGTTIGKITAPDMTAGIWKGTFNYTIELLQE